MHRTTRMHLQPFSTLLVQSLRHGRLSNRQHRETGERGAKKVGRNGIEQSRFGQQICSIHPLDELRLVVHFPQKYTNLDSPRAYALVTWSRSRREARN
uniref:Uncharacterized protein n=1 Tax=Zea mays TaxID=4577 RepID=C4J2X0_MAIZE|nr:unknown [Zea mays]